MLKTLNLFFRTPIFKPPYVLGKIVFIIGFSIVGSLVLVRFIL